MDINIQTKGNATSGIWNSITVKLISITIIVLLLLIPNSMIESLITEREQNQSFVETEVSQKWGGPQTLSGPFITIPYIKYHDVEKGKYATYYAHFLPEELIISGTVEPEILKRSIYDVILYKSDLSFKGQFKKPDFSLWGVDPNLIKWQEATLSMGIPDMTGIQKTISIKWGTNELGVSPGLINHDVVSSGVNARIKIGDEAIIPFEFELFINGSKSLNFMPLGKNTKVKLNSTWLDPSFKGNFVPDQRNVTNEGFDAQWNVLDLNRNYPQQWLGSSQSIANSSFGVDFLLPVDQYQKNIRSVKYSVLIIALSFLIFFLVEILNKKKFHPLQYIMVGLAISIFYVLLLSFTEHLGFDFAYAIASVLVISLICIYISAVFKSRNLTFLVTVSLLIIYFFIYVILQLQDYSLLVGSLGLFVALSLLMFLSRKIDWYSINKKTLENSLQQ